MYNVEKEGCGIKRLSFLLALLLLLTPLPAYAQSGAGGELPPGVESIPLEELLPGDCIQPRGLRERAWTLADGSTAVLCARPVPENLLLTLLLWQPDGSVRRVDTDVSVSELMRLQYNDGRRVEIQPWQDGLRLVLNLTAQESTAIPQGHTRARTIWLRPDGTAREETGQPYPTPGSTPHFSGIPGDFVAQLDHARVLYGVELDASGRIQPDTGWYSSTHTALGVFDTAAGKVVTAPRGWRNSGASGRWHELQLLWQQDSLCYLLADAVGEEPDNRYALWLLDTETMTWRSCLEGVISPSIGQERFFLANGTRVLLSDVNREAQTLTLRLFSFAGDRMLGEVTLPFQDGWNRPTLSISPSREDVVMLQTQHVLYRVNLDKIHTGGTT